MQYINYRENRRRDFENKRDTVVYGRYQKVSPIFIVRNSA